MANLRQDRVPDPTLSPPSAPGGQAAPQDGKTATPRAFVLAVRLDTTGSGGSPAGVSWNSAAPCVSLCTDLIRSSGGAPEVEGDTVLTAGFFNLQSALLTARRLHWALEGLDAGVHAGILLLSVEESTSDLTGTLGNAAPGQILVAAGLAASLQALPGMALSEAAQGGWRPLVWRSPGAPGNLADDEQLVLHRIRELGREDPCGSEAPPPGVTAAGESPVHWRAVPTREDEAPARGLSFFTEKKKGLILGGVAAAALVLAAVLLPIIFSGSHGKTTVPSSAPAAPAPPSANTTPASSSPAPPQPTVPDKQGQGKAVTSKASHASSSSHPARTDQTESAAPKASGKCDLTDAEIPRSLDRAENYLHAGRLSEAQAVYERVLGCPSAHERAATGLQLVKQRMAASPNP